MPTNKLTVSSGDLTLDISGRVGADFISGNNSTSNASALAITTDDGNNGITVRPGDTFTAQMDGFITPVIGRVGGIGVSEKNFNGLDFNGRTKIGTVDVDVAFEVSALSPALPLAFMQKAYVNISSDYGSLKLGTDRGLYGRTARECDNTVGYVLDRISVGHLGAGRTDVPIKAQMLYTLPSMSGFTASVGITSTQLIDGDPTDTAIASSGGCTNHIINPNQLGVEAELSYDISSYFPGVEGKVWASGLSQDVRSVLATTNGTLERATNFSAKATGFDYGTKLSIMGLELAAAGFQGNGLGVFAQFSGGVDGLNTTGVLSNIGLRKSDGVFVQASYPLPVVGTVLQGSFGTSNLKANGNRVADSAITSTRLDKNEMFTLGLRQDFSDDLNFKFEFANSTAKNVRGEKTTQKNVSFGGKWKF